MFLSMILIPYILINQIRKLILYMKIKHEPYQFKARVSNILAEG